LVQGSRSRPVSTIALAALALVACRSRYGVDPETDPARASHVPGSWKAEVFHGLASDETSERYSVDYDGSSAWASASVESRTRGARRWSAEVPADRYAEFVEQVLALRPFEWSDRSARSPEPEVLKLRFRAGDRGRSVRIENPSTVEQGLVARMRDLAGPPPAWGTR